LSVPYERRLESPSAGFNARDIDALVNESVVVHVYSFRGALVAHMEIEEPGSGRVE
jgi:hypothetical protein